MVPCNTTLNHQLVSLSHPESSVIFIPFFDHYLMVLYILIDEWPYSRVPTEIFSNYLLTLSLWPMQTQYVSSKCLLTG